MAPTCFLLLVENDISRVNAFLQWCPPGVRLVWAKSAGAALEILERDKGKFYSGILLDHALTHLCTVKHDRLLSGVKVTKAIIENISPKVPILIHSMSSIGLPRLKQMLEAAGFPVTRIPMTLLNEEQFLDWLLECECSFLSSNLGNIK